MTLLFADGFDHYTGGDEILRKYLDADGSAGISIINATPRRAGGYYAHVTGGDACFSASVGAAVDTVIVGFAIRTSFPPDDRPDLLAHAPLMFGSALDRFEFGAVLGDDGSLVAVRKVYGGGSVILGQTRAGVITSQNWHYIEVKGTIHDSNGAITIKVDGETEFEISEVRTNYLGSLISVVTFMTPKAEGSDFADIYICDTNGVVNNNFLGDVRVDTLYPTADGHYSEWDPYTGEVLTPGTHYDRVDDPHDIDETDYVETDVAGEAESYVFEDLSLLGADVFGVIVNTVARKTDAGFRALSALARIGSTDYWEDPHYISNAYWTHQHILELNPATLAAWNEAEINSAEFGFKLAV